NRDGGYGIELDIGGGWRRDIGRVGARDSGIDRQRRGGASRRIVLRQCRARRHREERRRDRHQDAVISSTALPTVTHYHTPWVSCFDPEAAVVCPSKLWRKRRPVGF